MKSLKEGLLLIVASWALIGCIEQPLTDNRATDAVDLDAVSVETVVDSLDKAANDAAEDEAPEVVDVEDLEDLPVDGIELTAPDRQCNGPAIAQRCFTNGRESKKIAEYDNCFLKGTKVKARGYVQLHFNNPRCSLAETGNMVNRTYAMKFTHGRRGSIEVTSADQRNYKGELLGGGGFLSKTDGGWQIEVDGRHQEYFNSRGRKIADVSVETGAPINIEGTLRRDARTIVSGEILVHHNFAKYTASYASRGLAWDGVCKCPVRGSLIATYSRRAREKSATIEFGECGKATITYDNGRSRDLKLEHCLPE